MLALMKKEEELLYRLKKKNGGHLFERGMQKHMTLNIKTYDPMVLCDCILQRVFNIVWVACSDDDVRGVGSGGGRGGARPPMFLAR